MRALGLPPCDWKKPGQIAQTERAGRRAVPVERWGSGRTSVAVQGGSGQVRTITSSDNEHEINTLYTSIFGSGKCI